MFERLTKAQYRERYATGVQDLLGVNPGDPTWRAPSWAECRSFPFGLWAFAWDGYSFEIVLRYVSPDAAPESLVFAEVDSLGGPIEAIRVACVPDAIKWAMQSSVLPHVRTACVSETGTWAIMFDNEHNQTIAVRSRAR